MSCPVNLQALPSGVFDEVLTPDNVRGRTCTNSLTPLSFPKSRSALWDGSPAGEKLRLQLCSHRKPRVVLLEKALRLAQRHVRHSNKSHLHCFFLGSVSVDSDEEGVTVTLDRFDPGRDQVGSSDRVPSAQLPGDVLVPCRFSTQTETTPDTVNQSEAELHHCFKVLQRFVSSRQSLDLSQLFKVRGHVICCQQSDAMVFDLSWSAVCPSVSVDVQPVRAVPVIPTALLRSLISIDRPQQHTASRQRGFLTMDQTRKLLLLLESDPKASNLPLVGLWLSGVTHIYNPQVLAWCLRFLFSSTLQDRVLSESGCFLLLLFTSTHRAPQFFQCRAPRPGPGPGLQLDCELLTAFQSVTLYQGASVDGRTLQCELGSEDHSRQMEIFREAQSSFNSAAPPAAGLSISDQDSGVEDEDLSPRPSPSPHLPAQQTRRVQPSVPELSLLIDSSFTSNHNSRQDTGSTHRLPPPSANRKSAPPAGNTSSTPATSSSSAPRPAPPPHLHSTPNSNPQQPCSCCSTHTYTCTSIFSSPGVLPAPPSHHHTSPPPSRNLPAIPSLPPSSNQGTPPSSHHSPPPPSPRQAIPPSFSHSAPPPSLHSAPLPSHNLSSLLSTQHHTSPPSTHVFAPPPPPSTLLPPPPTCPCSHPPLVPHCGDSPSPHPSYPADPVSSPWLPHPSCVNQCCDQVGGVVTSDTYQLLLHQDRQLRLLQAQVQMLLEAQGKLQSSSHQVDTQTPRTTASIAVGTGASLFWGDPVQHLPHLEVQAPPPSSPNPPSSSKSSSSSPSPSSSRDLTISRPVGGAEDDDSSHQVDPCPPSDQHSIRGLQSPVLGESLSMYRPADDQSFYQNLMTQLTSRLQESESRPGEEEEQESRRKSLSVVSDHAQSFQSPSSSSSSSSSSRRKQQQSPGGDPVVSATLRQLQQLGVDVDDEDLTESDRSRVRTVESASTLASINPAAVVSRLSVSDPSASSLFPGGSVDLSLEANAIALRYLSDSQLSRLSVGSHAPRPGPISSGDSLLSPSNMSLATRKYMRRYGLIEEEEDGEDEEEQGEAGVQDALTLRPLTGALNTKLLPQSQLIRDLRPKMQMLAGKNKPNTAVKENCSSGRPSLVRARSRQTEESVGNILDLSRLRQLPKLF